MKQYCYLTFDTVYHALRSEAVLRETNLPFKLVPVPRSISSSCGTALRCSCDDLAAIRERLVQGAVAVENSYGPL